MPFSSKPVNAQKSASPFVFVVVFLSCFVLSLLFFNQEFAQTRIKAPTAKLQTCIVVNCLKYFTDISRAGTTLYSLRYSIIIDNECTPYFSIALFLSATMAFPCGIKRKAVTFLYTATLIFILSLIRISLIYLTGFYFTDYVDIMHDQITQSIPMVIVSVFWLYRISKQESAH